MATVVPPLPPTTHSTIESSSILPTVPRLVAVVVATADVGALTIADTAALVAVHRTALDQGASLLWVETAPRRSTGVIGGAR